MEDPQQIDFMGQTIRASDAARFLNEKARGDQACEVCKATDWLTSFNTPEGGHAFIPSVKWEGATRQAGSVGMPAFLIACANCGYIRAHSMMILSTWLREQAKGDE